MANDGTLKFDTSIDASGFNKGLSKLGSIASTGIKTTTAILTGAATAITAVGAASIKVGSEFESSMSQVAATMGITADTIYEDGTVPFDVLSEAAKQAGETTQYSASEAAEALNYLALAGYDASTAAEVLPSVLNLAAAGGMDLAYASDLATDAMSALGIEASNENLTNFGDKLAVTAQKSNTSVSQLGEAILTVGATAKNLAGGTTELNTALGILADSGIKGAEGGTHLRNVLLSLQSPTDSAAASLEAYTNGVYDAEGNMRPLNDILGELNDSLSDMTDQEKTQVINSIFNKTDLAAAQVLLAGCADGVEDLASIFATAGIDVDSFGASIDDLASSFDSTISQEEYAAKVMEEYGVTADQANVMYSGFMSALSDSGSRFDELSGYIDGSTGAMADMADTMNDNLQGDIKILQSALEGLGISIYEGIDAPCREVVQTATDMVGQLSDAFKEGGFEGMVAEVGDVLAQIVQKIAESAPTIINAAVGMVKSFTDGLFQNRQAVSEAGAELITSLVQGIASSTGAIWNTIISIVTDMASAIAENAPAMVTAMMDAIEGIAQTLDDSSYEFTEAATNIIVALVTGIAEALPNLMAHGADIVVSIVQAIIDNLPELLNAALEIVQALIDGLIQSMPILIEGAFQLLLGIVQAIPQFIESLLAALPDIITAIITFFTDNIPLIIEGAISLLMGIIEAIPTIIQAIVDNLPMIITALVEGLVGALPQLLEASITLLMALIEAFPQIVVAIVENLPTIIGAILEGLFNAIPEILSAAVEMLWSIITAIPDIVAGIGEAMPQIIEGIVNGLLNGIASIGEAAKSLGSSIISGFKDILGIHSPSKVMEEQGDYLTEGLLNGISDMPDKMLEAISGTADIIAQWGTDLTNAGITAINAFMENIVIPLAQLPGKVLVWLTGVLNNVLQWGINLKAQANTAITTMVSGIVTLLSELPAKVWVWLVNVVNRVAQWGINLRAKGVEAVTTMINGMVTLLSTLPQKFVTVGSNIVQGIWQGISSGWDWLKGKVADLADSLLDAAKSALGINSPSKEFRDKVGKWLIPGITEGMERSLPEADADIRGVAGHLTSTMQAEVQSERAKVTSGTVARATYSTVNESDNRQTIDQSITQYNEYNCPTATPSEVNKAQREAARKLLGGVK